MKKILLTALIGMSFLSVPITQVYANDSTNSNVTATINEGDKTDESTNTSEGTTDTSSTETKSNSEKQKDKNDTGYIETGSTETYMYATIGGSILTLIIGFFLGRRAAKNN